MSIAWPDAIDTEADYEADLGELFDDSEAGGEDYEATSRSDGDWRRQARMRRIALARRRQAARGPRSSPAAAIRTLDLQTQVAKDTFRSSAGAQSRRMSRAEYSAVLSATVDQFIESFDAPDNPYFRAALRYSPLLLLAPVRRGRGIEAVVTDPRFVGAAAVAGITVVGENRRRFTLARSIEITGPSTLTLGDEDQFVADVLDGRGGVLDRAATWSSSDQSVVAIDAGSGAVVALDLGTTTITASVDDLVRRVRLTVTDGGV